MLVGDKISIKRGAVCSVWVTCWRRRTSVWDCNHLQRCASIIEKDVICLKGFSIAFIVFAPAKCDFSLCLCSYKIWNWIIEQSFAITTNLCRRFESSQMTLSLCWHIEVKLIYLPVEIELRSLVKQWLYLSVESNWQLSWRY